jgi:S1-C subfamily serine protease
VEGEIVRDDEERRIELIQRLAPAVFCTFDARERGGGSGVIIDPDGYALTNYHVVAGMMKDRKGLAGMSDGRLREFQVLGVDPTGDVAMLRLDGLDEFPYVPLGDSDEVRLGDPVIVMGNAFSLSEDYTPTVTAGIVTGVHRYQWGSGNNLVYSDCIQTDASINPGNSGGPLVDAAGRIIGINGRISVSRRGRYNVGLGYAISTNQIKRFLPWLRGGLLARHGTLNATVEDQEDAGVIFTRVLATSRAADAGLRFGDRLLEVDGTPITSRNHFASLLGTYPATWPLVLRVARPAELKEGGAVPLPERAEEFNPPRILPGEEEAVIRTRLEPIAPKLRRRFEVDQGVNLQAVDRLLRRFRYRVLEPAADPWANMPLRSVTLPPWPARWRWTIQRDYLPGADGQTKASEHFEATRADDGPVVLHQCHEDGTTGRIIEYSDRQATWWHPRAAGLAKKETDAAPTENPERFELPLDLRLVWGGLYIVQFGIARFDPYAEEALSVAHVGGDWITDHAAYAVDPAEDKADNARRHGVIAEVVEWPLGEHTVARLFFDARTSVPVRVTVTDTPSGEEAVIDLSDFRDVGGLRWFCRVDIRAGGWRFRDTYSHWDVEP